MTQRKSPIWLVLLSIVSIQVGAAFSKTVFGEVGPITMSWLRFSAAGLILLVFTRPSLRGKSRQDWASAIPLMLCLVGMNVAFYEAIARIPLGLAVTVEFLGPLGVSVIGSRRLRDLVWVGLAGIGVVILGFGPGSQDWLGVGFAALAGLGWAGYIIFGSRLSAGWRGGTGVLTMAMCLGAILLAVPGVIAGGTAILQPQVLAVGFAVGLMSSVVPYALELRALRTIPPRIFGILMALEPAVAAMAGIVVLHEWLGWYDWVAIGCVILASIGAVRSSRSARIGADSAAEPDIANS